MASVFRSNKVLLLLFIGISILQSCYERTYYTADDATLRFSTDTLLFDTVFTTVGSATRILKVYNDLDQAVQLDGIYLEEGSASKFRLNIDGIAGVESNLIEIGPQDSIYIFGEVTVDPDDPLESSPFVIEEKLIFDLNGTKQNILLEAWGQNANYIPGKFAKGKVFQTTCDMGEEIWDDPRPYVLYGTLLIDSCTLRIPAGTEVFFHGGFVRSDGGQEYNDGQLYILKYGKLLIEGTADAPVTFQTDRLEHQYDDISGLWSGLYILEGSTGNKIDHAILKNANIGIFLDSATTLDISYSKILHNISAGIYARHATVNAVNCLIADSGAYGFVGRYGGSYRMDYCTIANYNNQQEAIYLGNYQCLDYLCSEVDLNPLYARFRNCILYGNGDDELFLEDATQGMQPELFDYHFDHCLVAVDELLDPSAQPDFFEFCNSCLNGAGEEELFFDPSNYNFTPDTLSIVIDKGFQIPGITDDLYGYLRDNNPDIGCHEFH